MATIAQIRQQRQGQARKIRASIRELDSAIERIQRKITAYTRKRKVIEAADVPPLTSLYREMVSKVNKIEMEIINLGKLTGA